MIEITNRDIFGKVIAEAIVKSDTSPKLRAWERQRWLNAIAEAVRMIEDPEQAKTMEFHPELDMVTIWSLESNQVYNANGKCECEAFKHNVPCKHRAIKQLLKRYFEALETPAPVVSKLSDLNNAPYLRVHQDKKPELVGRIRI